MSGTVGNITIQTPGKVTFGVGFTATSAQLTIVAGGTVTGTIRTGNLDVTTSGVVNLSNTGALTVSHLVTNGAAITVANAGDLTISSTLVLTNAADLMLSTSVGKIDLKQSISSGSGAVALNAANGVQMGAQGDISSASGAVTINAGIGSMVMNDLTVVDVGAGSITLDAGLAITLGKLRSTSSADVVIHSGGVIDGGESSIDIIATGAKLVVVSLIARVSAPTVTAAKTKDWFTPLLIFSAFTPLAVSIVTT